MKRMLATLALASLLAVPAKALAFNPDFILSDAELTDPTALNLQQIEAFLDRGYLGTYFTEDYRGNVRSAAEIILEAAYRHSISPKFLLVLLQKEQSLITNDAPTQKALDWATGYAVCDYCSMGDPTIQRFKGFGKQVNSAAMQYAAGYLEDIEETGMTAGRYGPGVTVTIDGTKVTPKNAATAAMYAYTPHLHGNANFVRLWEMWFGQEYPSGTLLQVAGEPGVWLIEYGFRRPITSASALTSRFNKDLIITVQESSLDKYPIGKDIALPNYSLLKAPSGDIYLLVDDAVRHIESMEAFRKYGFNEDEVVDVTEEDLWSYEEGTPITVASANPQGQLLQLANGAVFYVKDGYRQAILDKAILNARFPDATITPAAPVEIEQYKEAPFLRLPDGYLVRGIVDPAVFVISEGKKLPIDSEQTFLAYGYSWDDIVFVSDDVLDIHPTGGLLSPYSQE